MKANDTFAAELATATKPSPLFTYQKHRTLKEDAQATFERYLHGAMGWKASTANF